MKNNSNSQYTIKRITAIDTYVVRHPMLRENKPIETCAFEGDLDENTLHLGLYYQSDLIGVATFIKNNNQLFRETNQYQLRGMAVLKPYQGKGLGKLLILEGEKLLTTKCQRIWFNAREIAVTFYKANGYQIIGNSFEIADVGTHYLMTKKINLEFH